MFIWIGFITLVFFLLALDLGVFNRNPHAITTREALGWTTLWVSLSLLFSVFIYYAYGNGWIANPESLTARDAVLKYLTGYLVEQSLSMDNIFVIAMIFSYFSIPQKYQHRVLFWGILGALVFRGIMIFLGVVLIQKFAWLTYVFGVFLLYSAYKMWSSHEAAHPNKNPVIKYVSRLIPVTKEFDGEHFFVKRKHITAATPLFVALMVVETTDVMFAFDSIPAIFAITTDPFLVFTSNIFAILGLRSLYFVLASVLDRFKYLQHALVFILAYVGVKMLLVHQVHIPEWVSLMVIFVSLGAGVLFSIYKAPKAEEAPAEEAAHDIAESASRQLDARSEEEEQ
ncbi:TerC family protein [Phaeodactylibacter xiamenensis]|jgi:tellurite resistance protein TerC|uniref:TerC family protein n=1 Tax=Phaeodactylibacter xiamenensis TaxID=1524460 RepID=UPI0024A84194|nr:TerC family protein [Phaeodactylibacter xiamenensis]